MFFSGMKSIKNLRKVLHVYLPLKRYEDAKKNNDFIYHMMEPDINAMEQIKGVDIVKPVPFPFDDKDVAGPDIFQRLVPMQAHEASSLYRYKAFVMIALIMT